jgi:hypothetical protein
MTILENKIKKIQIFVNEFLKLKKKTCLNEKIQHNFKGKKLWSHNFYTI